MCGCLAPEKQPLSQHDPQQGTYMNDCVLMTIGDFPEQKKTKNNNTTNEKIHFEFTERDFGTENWMQLVMLRSIVKYLMQHLETSLEIHWRL